MKSGKVLINDNIWQQLENWLEDEDLVNLIYYNKLIRYVDNYGLFKLSPKWGYGDNNFYYVFPVKKKMLNKVNYLRTHQKTSEERGSHIRTNSSDGDLRLEFRPFIGSSGYVLSCGVMIEGSDKITSDNLKDIVLTEVI